MENSRNLLFILDGSKSFYALTKRKIRRFMCQYKMRDSRNLSFPLLAFKSFYALTKRKSQTFYVPVQNERFTQPFFSSLGFQVVLCSHKKGEVRRFMCQYKMRDSRNLSFPLLACKSFYTSPIVLCRKEEDVVVL